MLLQDIQSYLKQQHRVSLQDIKQQFQMETDILREILDRLIRKGRVQKTEGSKCSHCSSCAPETLEFYEWMN